MYQRVITTGIGKVVRLSDLRVPVHVALGHYEAATDEELRELLTDLQHELDRRPDAARAA